MRIVLLALLATLSLTSVARPAVTAGGPVDLVVTLYRSYAWEAVIDEPQLASLDLLEQPRSVLQRYFDDHLVDLILRDRACRQTTREVCRLDFMPLWGSQDPAATGLTIRPADNPSIVAVAFRYPGNGERIKLSYRLSRTTAGWRINDIRGESFSLAEILRSTN